MMRSALVAVVLVAGGAAAHAGRARVTATTPATVYIDAGTAEGLHAGAAWHASIGGRTVSLRVVAVAAHGAVLELDAPPPAIGTSIELPATAVPPPPVTLRPAPSVLPPWHQPPAVLDDVQVLASREQPRRASDSDKTVISGELALSAFLAADAGDTSTSWQDLALSSQLAIESGAWRYDHLLELHLAGSPAVWRAPLQNAQARFDVYLLRLAYAPAGGRYGASFGRQPGATLPELGSIDGGQAHLALDPQLEVTVFAGLRPASDLSLLRAPRAGADLSWRTFTVDGLRARADVGVAVDEYRGRLDRAQTAGSALVGTRDLFAHADATVDLASDVTGDGGPRVSHTSMFVRAKRRALRGSIAAGFDRPFLARSLAAEISDLALAPDSFDAPRTYFGVDGLYALRGNLDVGADARVSYGRGFASTYVDTVAMWRSRAHELAATAAPYAVIGTLLNEVGVRGSVDLPPLYGARLGASGAIERVTANGAIAWAGFGRVYGGRPLFSRWRTSLSAEAAAGDGPVRLLFALLGYRLGQ